MDFWAKKLGGFAPRKEQIQKSPLHLKAVLGELSRQRSVSQEGPGDSGQHTGMSGHVSLITQLPSRRQQLSESEVRSHLWDQGLLPNQHMWYISSLQSSEGHFR